MSTTATLLIAVNLIGAGNGLIMGSFLLARRHTPAGLLLGILLAVASTTMVLITVEHAALVPRQLWLYVLEETLTLTSGPLLLHYVMLSVRNHSPPALSYLPPIVYLLCLLIDEGPVRVTAVLRDLRDRLTKEGDPMPLGYVYYGDVNLRLERPY